MPKAIFAQIQYQRVALCYLFVGLFSDMFRPDLIGHAWCIRTPNIRFLNLQRTKKTRIGCLDTTYKCYNFVLYCTLYLL